MEDILFLVHIMQLVAAVGRTHQTKLVLTAVRVVVDHTTLHLMQVVVQYLVKVMQVALAQVMALHILHQAVAVAQVLWEVLALQQPQRQAVLVQQIRLQVHLLLMLVAAAELLTQVD
jgi:hypothetical protein